MSCQIGTTAVSVILVEPSAAAIPFHVTAVWPDQVEVVPIVLDRDYLLPSVEGFVAMVRTGAPPLSPAELLAPINILSSVATRWLAPPEDP